MGGLVPKAGKGLAVVTCMDSRIELIASSAGIDTRSLEFRTTPDQIASLTEDLTRIKAHPMLPGDLARGRRDVRRGDGRAHPRRLTGRPRTNQLSEGSAG